MSVFSQDLDELQYEIILYWSEADGAYVAEVPELPGCMADGDSYEAAVKSAQTAMREWIQTAMELRREIPKPKGRLLFA